MEWNDQSIAELTKLWRAGLSASQVARQLGGLSRSAVIGKIHRLGVSGREAPSRPRHTEARPKSRRVKASHGGKARLPVARATDRQVASAYDQVASAYEMHATATLLTLHAHSCRWPIGDPERADFGFCGRGRSGQGPYCPTHALMSLRPRATHLRPRDIESIVRIAVERSTRWADAAY